MPSVRKLSVDEVRSLERKTLGVRKAIEAEYDAMLAEYSVGDYGIADLLPNENRLTVRNRMKAAASRRGFGVTFMRTNNKELLRFRITEAAENGDGEGQTEEEPEPAFVPVASTAEPPKRRGRPPKAASAEVASEPARRGRKKRAAVA